MDVVLIRSLYRVQDFTQKWLVLIKHGTIPIWIWGSKRDNTLKGAFHSLGFLFRSKLSISLEDKNKMWSCHECHVTVKESLSQEGITQTIIHKESTKLTLSDPPRLAAPSVVSLAALQTALPPEALAALLALLCNRINKWCCHDSRHQNNNCHGPMIEGTVTVPNNVSPCKVKQNVNW